MVVIFKKGNKKPKEVHTNMTTYSYALIHDISYTKSYRKNQVLKMNTSKTKVMMKNNIPIYVKNTQIENENENSEHPIPGQKNKHLGKTKDKSRLNKSEDGSGFGQGTQAGSQDTAYHHLETLRKETT